MYMFGTSLTEQQVIDTAEKWVPRLQELDTKGDLQLEGYLYQVHELGDGEAYISIMNAGLWFFTKKYNGPIPQEFIDDIKGFLAPSRDKDWGTQGTIRYTLDKLGIPT